MLHICVLYSVQVHIVCRCICEYRVYLVRVLCAYVCAYVCEDCVRIVCKLCEDYVSIVMLHICVLFCSVHIYMCAGVLLRLCVCRCVYDCVYRCVC